MGIDLAALRQKSKPLAVPFGDDVVSIEYYPGKVTPEYQTKIKRLRSARDDADEAEQWEVLLAVVAKWDITDGGRPVPLDASGMNTVPTSILGEILSAVLEDMAPNRKSAAASGATSQPAAS